MEFRCFAARVVGGSSGPNLLERGPVKSPVARAREPEEPLFGSEVVNNLLLLILIYYRNSLYDYFLDILYYIFIYYIYVGGNRLYNNIIYNIYVRGRTQNRVNIV